MNKQNEVPSVWRDLGTLAGLYREMLTMMMRRVRYGPDWPDSVMAPPAPIAGVQARRRERELVSVR